ncbi:MAG: hypothetical protein Q8P13_04045 [bacterium]|nr:hypothetical protein [bacterium]
MDHAFFSDEDGADKAVAIVLAAAKEATTDEQELDRLGRVEDLLRENVRFHLTDIRGYLPDAEFLLQLGPGFWLTLFIKSDSRDDLADVGAVRVAGINLMRLGVLVVAQKKSPVSA